MPEYAKLLQKERQRALVMFGDVVEAAENVRWRLMLSA